LSSSPSFLSARSRSPAQRFWATIPWPAFRTPATPPFELASVLSSSGVVADARACSAASIVINGGFTLVRAVNSARLRYDKACPQTRFYPSGGVLHQDNPAYQSLRQAFKWHSANPFQAKSHRVVHFALPSLIIGKNNSKTPSIEFLPSFASIHSDIKRGISPQQSVRLWNTLGRPPNRAVVVRMPSLHSAGSLSSAPLFCAAMPSRARWTDRARFPPYP
jgi:hypothetical protein